MPTILPPVLSLGLQPANAISRRGFLATMTGFAVAAITGCGPESGPRDSGPIPGPDAGPMPDGGLPASYRLENPYANLPCHFAADLDAYSDRILSVCTTGGIQPGDQNHLADFNPASATRPIPSMTKLDLPEVAGRSLNQFVPLAGSRGVVTANDGFYEVSFSPAGNRFIAFPAGVTYGGGAFLLGAKLFIAAANLVGASYQPGLLMVYDTAGDGSIQEASVRSIPTSRLNPTGLARRDASTLVLLNSGAFGGTPQASIDLINTATETIAGTIPLGSLTAQVSGELALSPDGRIAIVGTSDGSGRLLFVDLETGTAEVRNLPGTQFHSSIQVGDGRIFVTDFNGGTVTIMDLLSRSILQTIALLSGEAGPSEFLDGALLQAIPYGVLRVHRG